jgi:hypothetical protein
MILGNNIKHLVIGPGEEDESRFIARPLVPQNAVVSHGNQVI